MKIRRAALVLGFALGILIVGQRARAATIVDFSPDTTGVAVAQASITNSITQGQIVGDSFTLTNDVFLTGGSVFTPTSVGGLGVAVEFFIFSNPAAAAIIQISTTIDAVDSLGTTTATSLRRQHVSITPTFLAAGTYFFSLPTSVPGNFSIATGNYANGSLRMGQGIGVTTLPQTNNLGDMFFVLEGVPEPRSAALLALGATALVGRRLRRRL